MSTVHEPATDLVPVVQQLESLVLQLRAADQWRVPEVSAACDALACAAVLMRSRHHRDGQPSRIELLRDAVGLARSTVETTKFAAREQTGADGPADGH